MSGKFQWDFVINFAIVFDVFVFFRPLAQDFRVHLARIFNLEIMYWPESIKLEVCICLSGLKLTVIIKIAVFVWNFLNVNVKVDW